MSDEPVMTLVVGLVVAACALLAAFGIDITQAQVAAISGFVVAAIALGVWVRSKVMPTKKIDGKDRPVAVLEGRERH